MTDDDPFPELLALPDAPEAIRFACDRLRRMVDDGEIGEPAAVKLSVLLGMFGAELTKGVREEVRRLKAEAPSRVETHEP